MSELYILWAFMIGTLVVLGGLMVIFKGWMAQRDVYMGQSGGSATHSHSGHGHH